MWRRTPIIVKAGETLDLTARGTWWDFWIPCSADGYPAGLFHALGVPPRVIDDHRYFRLMGRIGDPGFPPSTDTPLAPQGPDATFVIGRHAVYTSQRAGRLYVFANDHDGMYWNNWGSVQLTVTRKEPSATTRTSPKGVDPAASGKLPDGLRIRH